MCCGGRWEKETNKTRVVTVAGKGGGGNEINMYDHLIQNDDKRK